MKKLLLTLLILFFALSGSVWASVGFVSAACGSSTDGLNATTASMNTTGASLIVVGVGYYVPEYGNVSTPTSSPSNSFTTLNVYNNTGAFGGTTMWYITSPTTSTSQTFTEAADTQSHSFDIYPVICAIAFSGTKTSPLDQQNGNETTSGTTLQPGNTTPTLNNEVLVAGFEFGSTGTASIDSSFTIPSGGQVNYSNGNSYGYAMAYLVQTTKNAVNPKWTNSGVASDLSTALATFEAIATASGRILKTAILNNANFN